MALTIRLCFDLRYEERRMLSLHFTSCCLDGPPRNDLREHGIALILRQDKVDLLLCLSRTNLEFAV